MKLRKPIKRKRGVRRGRLLDPKYLEFIRQQPCLLCEPAVARLKALGWQNPRIQTDPTEAAHVGVRGLSQKCSDRETIPLCSWHHQHSPDSQHKLGKKFWSHHELDRDALIEKYNSLFREDAA